MFKRLIVLGAAALILSACAGPGRVALDPVAAKQITEVSAESSIWQDEIIVRAQAAGVSGALGGGLIGAIIDSKIAESRQEKIQEVIEPFYASVDDVDFRQQFWASLEPALKNDFAVKVVDLKKTPTILQWDQLPAKKAALTADKGYLQMVTSYTFNQDFSRLNMVTGIDLWRGGTETPIYSNVLHYQSSPVGPGGNPSLEAWSANSGQSYRQAMTEAVTQIVKMLKIDIAASAVESPQAKTVALQKFDGPTPQQINGVVLEQLQGRAIVRNSDGRVYSLPQ